MDFTRPWCAVRSMISVHAEREDVIRRNRSTEGYLAHGKSDYYITTVRRKLKNIPVKLVYPP